MEGKRLAIDSSIWLYQFQATMRDKEGRVLVNAHVLGFLRRINKLLFHGIKPVFVFDGGAPSLKRSTIAERRRKKTGAAANHAKVAEKLFAAQMRREAVKAAQAARDNRIQKDNMPPGAQYEYEPEAGDIIDEGNATYLDDDVNSRPAQQYQGERGNRESTTLTDNGGSLERSNQVDSDAPVQEQTGAAAAAERRKAFKNHDPYRLPELPEGALTSARPTAYSGARPDPRMATEEEMHHFIEDMKPEDFDLTSPEFRSLSTEMQYEIIGDLRIRSRQQSHKRLASMLRQAPTPLDFSKAQIASLSQRNVLTQQLLTVTDTIGSSGLMIPTRVAAERNREYVLVKKPEAEGGGWVLGVRDQGTQDKPIVIEESPKKKRKRIENGVIHKVDDSDNDDVAIIPKPQVALDPEVRAMRQRQMIEAFTRRHTPKKPQKNLTYDEQLGAKAKVHGQTPLFAEDEDEAEGAAQQSDEDEDMVEVTGDTLQNPFDDEAVARDLQEEEYIAPPSSDPPDISIQLAVEESQREAARRRDEEDLALIRALQASRSDARLQFVAGAKEPSIAATNTTASLAGDSEEDDFEEVEVPDASAMEVEDFDATVTLDQPQHLDQPFETEPDGLRAGTPLDSEDEAMIEAAIALDQANQDLNVQTTSKGTGKSTSSFSILPPPVQAADDMHISPKGITTPVPDDRHQQPIPHDANQASREEPAAYSRLNLAPAHPENPLASNKVTQPASAVPPKKHLNVQMPARDSQVQRKFDIPLFSEPLVAATNIGKAVDTRDHPHIVPSTHQNEVSTNGLLDVPIPEEADSAPVDRIVTEGNTNGKLKSPKLQDTHGLGDESDDFDDDDLDDSRSLEWSLSPEPERRPTQTDTFPAPPPDLEEDEGGIDMNAEGDDYARFLAEIKGRNLEQVRQEIDNEIRDLNQQNKVAMRDSEDITHQMVAQIQLLLRLFGIPYVTAPMEAEAQCAELAKLDLVDGVITDDNDVFLFGGPQCFKNIFNDSKYVECFLASDLEREMSLTRERLISLAYLLGSDYTIGLPGVGPVSGMEIMANFPGPRGLEDFKTWWTAVQQGKDDVENQNRWQKSFKKKFSNVIYLESDWPNPAVREAYDLPTVDSSNEPFQWGFPDLIGLRRFLQGELSWSVSKVDDELTPIIQRVARRGQVGGAKKQTILDPFFDSSLGQGQFAPRVRTKHPSKRLQAVIKAYREAEARVNGHEVPAGFGEMLADLDAEPDLPLKTISEAEDVADAAHTGKLPARRKPAPKRKAKATTGDDAADIRKRQPKKRKTVDSAAASDATGTSAAAGNDNDSTGTPTDVSRGAARKRGKPRARGVARGGRGGTRGASVSRSSSAITTATMNDNAEEDFDDDWGRSIDEAIAKEMLDDSPSMPGTGTDKENSIPTRPPVTRPQPRRKQKLPVATD
ncbi:hypothetical protein QFC22_002149 [Naganishia vaughanmartiniae]|uniref:Uncharacterized protein n=1 Tax=Naganishia vaughanmartiniae TaxID=1424756 RepID=A0ACC2XDS0_9TREE|nr:hypothetical protein QFC22_002149 [Naganishia vaughanmartiniae]